LNDGLFVALTEEHLAYRPAFLEACARCGIPAREIPAARALEHEPRLNPRLLAAIQIPDGVFDPYRFCLSFLATAHRNGARILTFTEVIGIDVSRCVVQVRDRRSGQTVELPSRREACIVGNDTSSSIPFPRMPDPRLVATIISRGVNNGLHAPDPSIFQHHLDAVRVRGAFRQEAQHDAFRQRARALVLLLDNLHPQAGADLAAFGEGHKRILTETL